MSLKAPGNAKTSLTHPLRVDEVAAGRAGGLIGITFCPGKSGSSLRGLPWARDLNIDLDAVKAWGADAVVTLIEDHEFELLGVAGLGVQVRFRGMQWHHLPIVDVQIPDARFHPIPHRRVPIGAVLLMLSRAAGDGLRQWAPSAKSWEF